MLRCHGTRVAGEREGKVEKVKKRRAAGFEDGKAGRAAEADPAAAPHD